MYNWVIYSATLSVFLFIIFALTQAEHKFKVTNFVKVTLLKTNEYRRKHKTPPLILNQKLIKGSNDRAYQLAKQDYLLTRLGIAGENICSRFIHPELCIDDWYNEREYYDFTRPQMLPECKNFTQLIWKQSKKFGIGYKVSESGKYYVVARFLPRGNILGDFDINVLPSKCCKPNIFSQWIFISIIWILQLLKW